MTVRRNRKTEPVKQAPAMTVADYYRAMLTGKLLPATPNPTYEDYLRAAARREHGR